MTRAGNIGLLGVAIFALILSFAPLSGSFSKEKAGGTYFYLDLSDQGHFFDIPFPSDARVNQDGTIDMSAFPNKVHWKIVRRTKEAVSKGYGFSTGTAVYFHASGKIDTAGLPAGPAASLGRESTVFLVDIDPDSPEYGKRLPVITNFYSKKPAWKMGPKNLLAVMALPGFVMLENTTYAVLVMKDLGDAEGDPLACDPAFEKLKNGKTPDEKLGPRAEEVYGPLWDYLEEAGIDRDGVAAATVFTTGDPAAEMLKIFEYVDNMEPLKLNPGYKVTREYPDYYVIEGTFTAPQFQTGEPPFGHGKGGRIIFDDNGLPIVQRHQDIPVAITVPKTRMPADGFPLLVYVHGTSGVSTQFIDRGYTEHHMDLIGSLTGNPKEGTGPKEGEGPALIAARRGIAAVGAAQPIQGERGAHPSQLTFYNFFSPEALRDNIRQAAAEAAMLVRLMQKIEIDPSLCPETDVSASRRGGILFDADLFFTMGQSLGSIIIGVFAPVETDIVAAIPSGEGAHWSVFIADANVMNLKSWREKGLGVGEFIGLDLFNPFTTMLATALAPADPLIYAPHLITRPFPGREPKNVWMPAGLYDHYFSPMSQNAIITSSGVDMAGEIIEKSTLDWMELSGARRLDLPVSNNIKVDGKKVTGMSMHYVEDGIMDGHDINFQLDETKYQYGCFLYSIANEGKAIIYEPKPDFDEPCGQ